MKSIKFFVFIYSLMINAFSYNFVSAQLTNFTFEYITSKNGLSQNAVYAIHQDKKGFLWFGTEDGLNRYDGYEFKIFRYAKSDSTTLSNNWVTAIVEDSYGFLWIGTKKGLNKFDPVSETFESFYKSYDKNSISGNYISYLYIDKKENVWISTHDGGLCYYDRLKKTFTKYQFNEPNEKSSRDNNVYTFYEDNNGDLWIGTSAGGLNKLNIESGEIKRYLAKNNEKSSLPKGIIRFILGFKGNMLLLGIQNSGLFQYDYNLDKLTPVKLKPIGKNSPEPKQIRAHWLDKDGILWIGTLDNGIYQVDLENKTYNNINDTSNKQSININTILSIFRDNTDNLWVGTSGGGVNKFKNLIFSHYKKSDGKNSLSSKMVWSFWESKEGKIWIGTGKGVNLFDPKSGSIKRKIIGKDSDFVNNSAVWAIEKDPLSDVMWIGTSRGLIKYNSSKNEVKVFKRNQLNGSISHNQIWKIIFDNYNRMWIGTDFGLNLYDRTSETFTRFFEEPNKTSLLSNSIGDIIEDKNGNLWIGTQDNGISIFNNKTNVINSITEENGLTSNNVTCLLEDSEYNIWIGTEYGLNKYINKTDKVVSFSTNDGLLSDYIYGVLEDENKNIWISTNHGISCYLAKQNVFKNYTVEDGLQENEFNIGAFLKLQDGHMLFGGINGFNIFDPNEIKRDNFIPQIVLTELKIFNRPVGIGEKINEEVLLPNSISEIDKLVLTHNENFFTLKFAALHFTNPIKNKYEYILEGFNSAWIESDGNREATFTNLDAGEYKFRVKASNPDGVWNEMGTVLKVVVLPPWWKTKWFVLTMILVITTMIFIFHFYRIEKVKESALELNKNNLELNNQLKQNKIKEEELTASLIKMKNVLDSISSAIICINKKHEIVYCNSKVKDILEIEIDEVVGEILETVFTQYDFDSAQISEIINLGREKRISDKTISSNGKALSVDIYIYPLAGQSGKGAMIQIDQFLANHG